MAFRNFQIPGGSVFVKGKMCQKLNCPTNQVLQTEKKNIFVIIMSQLKYQLK